MREWANESAARLKKLDPTTRSNVRAVLAKEIALLQRRRRRVPRHFDRLRELYSRQIAGLAALRRMLA